VTEREEGINGRSEGEEMEVGRGRGR